MELKERLVNAVPWILVSVCCVALFFSYTKRGEKQLLSPTAKQNWFTSVPIPDCPPRGDDSCPGYGTCLNARPRLIERKFVLVKAHIVDGPRIVCEWTDD